MQEYKNFLLKNISWVKIGGETPVFIETDNDDEFIRRVKEFKKAGDKFEVIGFGANTLFSDDGVKTPVIKNKSNYLEILEKTSTKLDQAASVNSNERHKAYKNENITSGYDYDDINYTEPEAPDILVKATAGLGLPFMITHLISKGITGLHMFAGIPGTVGGSVFNNIHGGPKLLSEFIDSVEVIDNEGNLISLTKEELGFGYNQTRFQDSGEIITSATFRLKLGDKQRALHAMKEWAKRKSSQPRNSLGSVFHNLSPEEQQRLGFPTPGIAYLIEHKLKLSGYRVGDIMIPEQTDPEEVQVNKNIFMNLGNGTAKDYLAVMKKVYKEAYEQYGIKLKPEVFFKGFKSEEIKEFLED